MNARTERRRAQRAIVKNPGTLQEFRRLICSTMSAHGRRLRTPHDDWPNMLLFTQTPDGVDIADLEYHLARAGMSELLASGQGRDAVSDLVKLTISDVGAYRYGMVLNAHFAALDRTVPNEARTIDALHADWLRVKDIVGAEETLMLTIGDADLEEYWRAPIRRNHRNIRTLAAWQRLELSAEPNGRFVGLNELLKARHR